MKTPLWAKLALALAVGAFLFLGCLWIEHPGLYYDEMLFVAASYPGAGGCAWRERLFGADTCLMVMPYVGGLKGWLYRGLLELIPASAAAVRVPMLVLAALTIGLFFSFARRACGWKVALASAVLAATDPSFLWTSRLDWGPVVIQRLCLVLGCLLVLRWWENRRLWNLAAGFFVFGLGVFDKAHFVLLLFALSVTVVVVFRKETIASFKAPRLAAAGLAFLLGSALFFLYFLQPVSRPPEITLETNWERYHAKYAMLRGTLDGTNFQGWASHVSAERPSEPQDAVGRLAYQVSGEGLLSRSWMTSAVLVSLLLLPLSLRSRYRRAVLFSLLFCLFALIPMFLVQSAGSVHHIVLVYPFPCLFVAASLVGANEQVASHLRRTTTAVRLLLPMLILALAVANCRNTVQQHVQLQRFGGTRYWSEAVYALHESLCSITAQQVVVLPWGIANQLRFLSKNRLPLTEVPQPNPGTAYTLRVIGEWVPKPGTVFVSYASAEMAPHPEVRDMFFETAAEQGRSPKLKTTVADLQGRTVYELWEVQ